MSKRVLVCDLDDSFINTKKHKRDLFLLARRLGAKNPEETYKKLKSRQLFNVTDFSKLLFSEASMARRYAAEAKKLLQVSEAYNYEGSRAFVKALKKKFTLILLTHGHPGYQRAKLRQSGLAKYFSKVVITGEHSKKNALHRFKNQFGDVGVIDNSEEVIKSARSLGLPNQKLGHGTKSVEYFERILKKLL